MKKTAYLLLIVILFAACKKEDIAQETLKTSMLDEVNNLRRSGCQCGDETMPPVPDLVWNDKLEKASARHVKDMVESNIFGHTGSDGSSTAERITGAGYRWAMCGENVAFGYNSVKDVVSGWKSSPGHCRNMMDAGFKELGAAKKDTFWVQDFGTAQIKNKRYKSAR